MTVPIFETSTFSHHGRSSRDDPVQDESKPGRSPSHIDSRCEAAQIQSFRLVEVMAFVFWDSDTCWNNNPA
jgi:hypothetical protein